MSFYIDISLSLNVDRDRSVWFNNLIPTKREKFLIYLGKLSETILEHMWKDDIANENNNPIAIDERQASILNELCDNIVRKLSSENEKRDQLTRIELEKHATLKSSFELVELRAKNEILEKTKDSFVNDALLQRIDSVELDLRKKLENKESKIAQLQSEQLDKWVTVHNNVVEMEKRWDKFVGSKNVGSNEKGKSAESLYDNLLCEQFPKHEVYNTSGIPHVGDFHLISRDTNKNFGMIVELKNYTQTVPSLQIKKFKNDVQNCCEYNLDHLSDIEAMHGILISVNSGIATKSNLEIEIINNKNVLVYLPNHACDQTTLACAVEVISHLHSYLRLHDEENKQQEKMLKLDESKREFIVKNLNNILKEHLQLRTSLQSALKLCDDKYINNVLKLIT